MELFLIYFLKKVREKTAELEYHGVSYTNLLVLVWLAGEIMGFLLGCKVVSSWLIRYLIGSCCGIGAGWLIYRKAMRLEEHHSDYYDLEQSQSYQYINAESVESLTNKKDMVEVLKERNKQREAATTEQPTMAAPENPGVLINQSINAEFLEHEPESPPVYTPLSKPEFQSNQQPEPSPIYKPKTEAGFRMPDNPGLDANIAATTSNIFQFPYNELLPINELVVAVYGVQTVKDCAIATCPWFANFKAKYENQEFKAATMILENALYEDIDNGLIWLLFGVMYKDIYRDYDKALQFCLTGAKRCNTYKIALLTEAAEMLLLGKKDILNAFKFFCLGVIAITDASKAWGNPNLEGCIAQERAFHFVRVLLTAFNFNDYRLYLERNVQFYTGMDQTLIENVLSICTEYRNRIEIKKGISQMFPLIIEKLQALV